MPPFNSQKLCTYGREYELGMVKGDHSLHLWLIEILDNHYRQITSCRVATKTQQDAMRIADDWITSLLYRNPNTPMCYNVTAFRHAD